ncbi:MAG: hypothetical protein AAGJ80_19410, partial [Cyanobacteria bacterium J06553_1]
NNKAGLYCWGYLMSFCNASVFLCSLAVLFVGGIESHIIKKSTKLPSEYRGLWQNGIPKAKWFKRSYD